MDSSKQKNAMHIAVSWIGHVAGSLADNGYACEVVTLADFYIEETRHYVEEMGVPDYCIPEFPQVVAALTAIYETNYEAPETTD